MTITFIKIVAPNILFEILDNSTLRQMSFFGQTIPNKAPLQTNEQAKNIDKKWKFNTTNYKSRSSKT